MRFKSKQKDKWLVTKIANDFFEHVYLKNKSLKVPYLVLGLSLLFAHFLSIITIKMLIKLGVEKDVVFVVVAYLISLIIFASIIARKTIPFGKLKEASIENNNKKGEL